MKQSEHTSSLTEEKAPKIRENRCAEAETLKNRGVRVLEKRGIVYIKLLRAFEKAE